MENQPTPAPEPARIPEYATIPADDLREYIQAAFADRSRPTASDRVGQTAQTTASLAGFGLLVAGVGWAGVKALNYLENARSYREMLKKENEQALVLAKVNASKPPTE